MTAPEHFLTDHDLAKIVGKSAAYVRSQCTTRKWPHLRVGRAYRFTPGHVQHIATLLEVAPAEVSAAAQSWGRRKRGA
jgi:hypothetical protein